MRERAERRQRWRLLVQLERWLETPMVVLGLVWLLLLVLELTRGIGPALERVSLVIWGIFVVDFVVRLVVAPDRPRYLRRNWLTAVALVVPAFRALRALRAIRFVRGVRGVRLVRVLTSLNRGMRALGQTMRRRRLGYVLALTALVVLGGSAGMFAFEGGPAGLKSYGEALWWTAMLLTTIASEYWPRTVEGRVLAFALSAYALGVLGYVTAALASFFIGADASNPQAGVASEASIRALRAELRAMRAALGVSEPLGAGGAAGPAGLAGGSNVGAETGRQRFEDAGGGPGRTGGSPRHGSRTGVERLEDGPDAPESEGEQ